MLLQIIHSVFGYMCVVTDRVCGISLIDGLEHMILLYCMQVYAGGGEMVVAEAAILLNYNH